MSSAPLPTSPPRGRPTISQLVLPFFLRAEGRWKAYVLLALNLIFMFGLTYVLVWANRLAGQLVDSLIARNWNLAISTIGRAIGAGLSASFLSITQGVFTNFIDLQWRTWLTGELLRRWTSHNVYYDIERDGLLSNADQRIAEDVKLFTNQTLSLVLGFISAIVMIGTYGYNLWGLSGTLRLNVAGLDIKIPGYMLWVAIIVTIGQVALAHWVGNVLIRLNYRRQTVEADFRFRAIQLRENAEQIAFYGGGPREHHVLASLFERIRQTVSTIYLRTGKVMFVQDVYARFFDPVATIATLPRYFAGEITMGTMTQVTGAYTMFSGALSIVNQSYIGITEWLGVTNRLRDLYASIRHVEERESGITVQRTPHDELDTTKLRLRTPQGAVMTFIPPQRFGTGERWLISGPSGTGKSTFLRAVAGLWPYGEGGISIPQNAMVLFLPQRSYIPDGDLKSALTYPAEPNSFSDSDARHVLEIVRLSTKLPSLTESAAWQRKLSGGEQQRIAIARALLHKPAYLFLDEATSALDESSERELYEALISSLPDSAIISVAHRGALRDYHWHFLDLLPNE